MPTGSRGMQQLSAPAGHVSCVPRTARRSANPQPVAGAPAATPHSLKHVSSGRLDLSSHVSGVPRSAIRRSANPQNVAGAPAASYHSLKHVSSGRLGLSSHVSGVPRTARRSANPQPVAGELPATHHSLKHVSRSSCGAFLGHMCCGGALAQDGPLIRILPLERLKKDSLTSDLNNAAALKTNLILKIHSSDEPLLAVKKTLINGIGFASTVC
jgi:hypothetical protein